MPMMILGAFPFSISTAAYQSFKLSTSYNWAEQNRLGHPIAKRLSLGGPALQYIGPGQQTIQLSGTIYPQFHGSGGTLLLLRLQAGTGIPLLLLSFTGLTLGFWIVKQIEETHTIFLADGRARKIEFNLSLQRHVELELFPFNFL